MLQANFSESDAFSISGRGQTEDDARPKLSPDSKSLLSGISNGNHLFQKILGMWWPINIDCLTRTLGVRKLKGNVKTPELITYFLVMF